MVLNDVSKRYRRPASFEMATTLKSYLLRDAWRCRGRMSWAPQPAMWALRHISLTWRQGQSVGIIGRNGSGKSTLLKLISRILKPDGGQVWVCGRLAALIELGAGFHPELTGRENIVINGVILGLSKAEIKARIPEIIHFADIGACIDDPVRTYSSGMYARLGFAVAIHVEPDILLVDEILSVGDAEFTHKCHLALNRFKNMGKLIVVVSHDLITVQSWCEDALWLDGGKLRMQGPTPQVIEAYEHAMQLSSLEANTKVQGSDRGS